MALMCWVF